MELEEQQQTDAPDTPTTSSWSEDWAKAEEAASSYEERFETEASEGPSESGDSAASEEPPASDGEQAVETQEPPESGESDGDQAATGPDPELDAFKAQAKKLGYSIDERQVAKQERVSLRKERKEMRSRLAEQQQEVEQSLQQKATELEGKYQKAAELQRAIEEDNLDGIAQAAGYKDWTEINKAFLNKQLNPQHKEMLALRRQLKEREEREQADRRAEQERQAQERQVAEQREYKRDLQDDISDLEDERLSQFHDDPMFVEAVFHHQRKAYDGTETISVQEAAGLAYTDAQKLYQKLHARFGDRSTQTSEKPASGATAEKPAEATGKRRTPPKTVSQSQVADASENAGADELDEAAWRRKWAPEMANSSAQP